MACINPYPVLPEHMADDARLFVDRQAMMRTLRPLDGARVAELGTLFGENADFILTLNPAELHLLDVDFTLLAGGPTKPEGWRAPLEGPSLPHIREHAAVTLHQAPGDETLAGFAAGYFDWVYVDGDHQYAAAYRDGKAAMRAADTVIFNDYTNWSIIERTEYGVMTAVNQLLNETEGWEIFGLALQRDGYHDIGIWRI